MIQADMIKDVFLHADALSGVKHDDFAVLDLGSLRSFQCEPDAKLMFLTTQVFPGIYAHVCDYQGMSYMKQSSEWNIDFLNITYCLEGRVEWYLPRNRYAYLAKDMFRLDVLPLEIQRSVFPTKKLRTVTWSLDVKHLPPQTQELFHTFDIDIEKLYHKFDTTKAFYVRSDSSLKAIFQTLLAPYRMTRELFLIKLLETLLYVQSEGENLLRDEVYIKKSLLEAVYQAEALLTKDISQTITIDELASHANISPTALKKAFKHVYGLPIRAYLIDCRLRKGKELLTTTASSITEIALLVGYENASKFSAAFKRSYGESPSSYRQKRRLSGYL